MAWWVQRYIFTAYDGVDVELYKSDGTTGNATKIDINPGTGSSYPYYLTARSATELVFVGFHDSYGTEIFRYNTVSGITTPYDIYPGLDADDYPNESYPEYVTLMGGNIYFTAYNTTYGNEMYKMGAGAPVVIDIVPGALSSEPAELTAIGNALYFSANTTASGYEPYIYNGTTVSLIKDIVPGAGSSYAGTFFQYKSMVYFVAEDAATGAEVWRTDGTSANTRLFKDVSPGTTSSAPFGFYEYNTNLYFNARTIATGLEMWVTDGAADANGLATSSTQLFKEINPGALHGGFYNPVALNSLLFFVGYESTGPKAYVTDGRACATIAIPPFAGGITTSANLLVQVSTTKLLLTQTLQNSGREPFIIDPAAISLPIAVNITAHPAPTQTVTMPATASFSVTATGTGLTYQWQKNAVNIAGATSATYTIPTTIDTDAATYRVVVTGSCGQATSNNAVLSVNVVSPTSQPSALVFTGPTTASLSASFTASSTPSSGYLVLRKKGSLPTETPVDGTTYAASSALGTSFVVKANSAVSFTDGGLVDASEYFYAIFSFNGAGTLTKYLTTLPLTGSSFTLAAEPAAQPTALIFTNVDGTTLSGSFTGEATATKYLVIRKAGSAPTGVPVDGKVYTTSEVIGDATVAYLGDSPSFDDTGLAAQTTYHYKVFAARGPASTINYRIASPLSGSVTTLTATPEMPVAFRFTNVTSTGFTISFTAPANVPAGYLVLRNQGNTLTATPTDGSAYVVGQTVGDARVAYIGASPTFDETLPLAAYTYAVFPYNGAGASINYAIANPLTGFIAPDNSAPVITDQTVASIGAGSSLTISATIIEPSSGIQEVTVEYKSIAKGGATTVKPMIFNVDKYELLIPANEITELGVEYTISATNTVGLTATKANKTILTYNEQTIAVGAFGDDETKYRIIAVPLDLSAKTVKDVFEDDLGPYDGVDWRMYRHDGSATNELTASSLIEAGKGYWLIVRNPGKNIDTGAGSTVGVTSAAPFTIDIKSGWNQIGNPYNFNVLWSDVTGASNINVALRLYVGGWGNGDRLNKGQGGFVFANAAGTLKFPTQYNGAAGRVGGEPQRLVNSIDQNNWEVMFTLRNGATTNIFGGFGMNTAANESYDEFDDFTLPRFIGYVELNHDKKVHRSRMTKDVVNTSMNHTWDFTVETSNPGATDLVWDNSYFGENDRNIVLWDEEESLAIDMKSAGSYGFTASGPRRFRVFFGDKEYVSEKSSANEVRIHTLSPNPTEGIVNLTFTIPGTEQQTVDVKVLNTLGQPVSSVFNGILGGGVHSMLWMGTDANGVRPSPGVYLVEVVSNGQRIAKRVVLR